MKIKNFILFFVLISIFLSSALFYVFQNRSRIQELILEEFKNNFGIEIEYHSEAINLFPSLGLELKDIKISNAGSSQNFEVTAESLHILLTWESLLLKNIQVKNITIIDGELNLYLKKQKSQNQGTISETDFRRMLGTVNSLNIQSISFTNSHLYIFSDNNEILENLYFQKLQYSQSMKKDQILADTFHRGGQIKLEMTFNSKEAKTSWKDLEWNARIQVDHYSPLSFEKYFRIFKNQNFTNAILNGDFIITKLKGKEIINCINHFHIQNLNFKNIDPSPKLSIQSELSFNPEKTYLGFDRAEVQYGNYLLANTTGYLDVKKDLVNLYLEINGISVHLEKALPFILGFVELKLTKKVNSPSFYGLLKILSQNTQIKDHSFKNAKVDLEIKNKVVLLNIYESEFYNGKVWGSGKIIPGDKLYYDFSINIDNINSYQLIKHYTNSEYLTGQLSSEFELRSEGKSLDEFLKKLHIFGKFYVANGKLLGYANFFKPVLAIGKYLNWQGPKGESTEFQSFSGFFNAFNKKINFQNIQLEGVGMDAKAEGSIDFAKRIDLKINLSLGGLAGKAISIPIFYQGIAPNNTAFIDPVWIGSVYMGTTFLGGPIGGLAGSAISDYVEKGFKSLKGIYQFFQGNSQSEQ